MNCQQVEDLISMYIENELSDELHDEVTLHLEQCSLCRQVKNQVEELLYVFPDLEEEVPFFLKNRLYYIPESQQVEEIQETRFYYLKWIAAVVGTFVLFLNLFYFTNIYPPANRVMHTVVSKIETFAVQTGALIERVKESRDLLVSSLFATDSDKDKDLLDKSDKIQTEIEKNNHVDVTISPDLSQDFISGVNPEEEEKRVRDEKETSQLKGDKKEKSNEKTKGLNTEAKNE